MNVEEYLMQGEYYHGFGYATDGCSIVGWFVHKIWPQLERACWSHDFARQGVIKVSSQSENDNLFKDALKYLGAPRPLRFIMYTFTKAQGWTKDRLGWDLGMFITALIFLTFLVIGVANASERVNVTVPLIGADSYDIYRDDAHYVTSRPSDGVTVTSNGYVIYNTDGLLVTEIVPLPVCYRIKAMDENGAVIDTSDMYCFTEKTPDMGVCLQ